MIALASSLLILAIALPAQPPSVVNLTGVPSTVRVGQVISARLEVEAQFRPDQPQLPKIDGLRFAIGGAASSRFESIVNGRRTVRVSYQFPMELMATKVGKFEIPPIEVTVGDKTYKTRKRVLEAVANLTGRNFGALTVVASRRRVYVHQPVTFDVECTIDSELELATGSSQGQRFYAVMLEAAWLSEMKGAEIVEAEATTTDEVRYLALNNRLQSADVRVARDDKGKSVRVFRFKKTFMPTRTGVLNLEAPFMRFTVLGEVRRDAFGFGTRSQKEFVVSDEPIAIEVRSLPKAGRPDPFYGAVGRFELAASLDKPLVEVGGSVKLTLTVTGDGNTEYLRVPELDEVPGFHQLGKIMNRSVGKVTVTYDLAAKTAEVSAIPSIEWNYFDPTPGIEKYVVVATDPLGIAVRAIEGEASLSELPGAQPDAVVAGADDIFDVKLTAGLEPKGLDPAPRPTMSLLFGVAPWLLSLFGLLFWRARRRSLADVAGRRARGAVRSFRQALSEGREPLDAFVDFLADRLDCEAAAVIGPDLAARLVGSGIDSERAAAVQRLVDEGVAARYGGGGGVDRVRVEAMVEALEQAPNATPISSASLLLFAISLLSSAVAAQDAQLSAAEQAYRERDYVAAADGFREAAAGGDRRAFYNLGNCLFRQGRYARALAAYEQARLAMPRDAELLANIRLTRARLELGSAESEPFTETIAGIRDRFTPRERFLFCLLLNVLAAVLVCFGGRRGRIVGFVFAVPALLLLVEVAVLHPARPKKAIIVDPKVAIRAEPSSDLEALMQVRAGVAVEVLGGGSSNKWTQVRAEGRKGFVPTKSLVVVE